MPANLFQLNDLLHNPLKGLRLAKRGWVKTKPQMVLSDTWVKPCMDGFTPQYMHPCLLPDWTLIQNWF